MWFVQTKQHRYAMCPVTGKDAPSCNSSEPNSAWSTSVKPCFFRIEFGMVEFWENGFEIVQI